jgi:hypothetical protein
MNMAIGGPVMTRIANLNLRFPAPPSQNDRNQKQLFCASHRVFVQNANLVQSPLEQTLRRLGELAAGGDPGLGTGAAELGFQALEDAVKLRRWSEIEQKFP